MKDFQLEISKIINRLKRLAKKRNRAVNISRSSLGHKFAISDVQNNIPRFFEEEHNDNPFVIFSNLGLQDETNRIRWPSIRYAIYRRFINYLISIVCSILPASKAKNSFYRMIGYKIGRNVEISQSSFLDPFCPPLIEIGDETVIGSFTKLFVHAYKGNGEVIIGKVKIGRKCKILGDSLIGPVFIDDESIIMLKTNTIPYFTYIPKGSMVGFSEPSVCEKARKISTEY